MTMNLGIVLPNWIGDCVMATPALRALRRRYAPPHRIVGIMRPYVAEVLEGTEWLDEQVHYHRHSGKSRYRLASVVDQLQHRKLDAIVLLTNSLSSAWLAWRSGAAERVGYARNLRSPLLTHRLRAPRDGWRYQPISAVDYYLDLAYAMDCLLEPRQLELATTAQDEAGADRVWKKFGLDFDAGVTVLSTGGAFGSAKRWPEESFAALGRRIAVELGHAVLVICGPQERSAAEAITRKANHPRVFSLAQEELSIGLSKACVRRSQLMVATDSGPRHFAAAFDVPVVSLFGPTDPRWSINYHADETRLFETVPCGPCRKRTCPLGHHACMRNLDVDRVFAAVQQKIDKANREMPQPTRRAA